MKKEKMKFPPIGQRILRSMFGVVLCFVVYCLRGRQGIPFYSALAVLQCIQPYQYNSFKMVKQRTTGTFVGAFWGLVVLLIELYALPGFVKESMIGYLIISLGTGVVLYSTVLINRKNASYFSCVVFLSITVMHMTDSSPFIFVINRVVDTLIGVAMAVLVNAIHFPRKKHPEILFVSGIDGDLLNQKGMITPYSKVELNRLIDAGAKFTVSTMRTPASIMETLSEIRWKLPIITMDGAALFDVEKNSYLFSYSMTYDNARKVLDFIKEYKMQCFVNVIVDDLLIIYYGEGLNDAEMDILHKLGRSPYRNYVKRSLPEGESVTFGSIQGEADVWIENADENQVVKELKKRFEPIGL